jgi:hypothetical protein
VLGNGAAPREQAANNDAPIKSADGCGFVTPAAPAVAYTVAAAPGKPHKRRHFLQAG